MRFKIQFKNNETNELFVFKGSFDSEREANEIILQCFGHEQGYSAISTADLKGKRFTEIELDENYINE